MRMDFLLRRCLLTSNTRADVVAWETLELSVIEPLIRKVWCRESASPSSQNEWSEQNPSWGQCAVTALLVQDIEGGELIRTVVDGFGSHYYNRLPSGQEIDLTRDQFPEGSIITPGDPADREYVLDSERAAQARSRERYEILKERFHRLVLANLIGLQVHQR